MSEVKALTIGLVGEATTTVTQDKTALAVGSGKLAVYATPMMVALMEEAAVKALDGQLPAESDTVGIQLEILHLAATPIGMNVRGVAKLINIEDRKLTFEVEAFDQKEKIGSGIHQRYIINAQRFMAKCDEKGKGE